MDRRRHLFHQLARLFIVPWAQKDVHEPPTRKIQRLAGRAYAVLHIQYPQDLFRLPLSP